jgi:PPOX class probable F420-dependent enzyme
MKQLTDVGEQFVTDYHLATLSTLARDESIHVVAVGFTLVDGIARIITSGPTQKVRNLRRDPRASIGQVEGARWLSLAGRASILEDAASVDHAVALYTARYRAPRPNPLRVVIAIEVDKLMGSSGLLE